MRAGPLRAMLIAAVVLPGVLAVSPPSYAEEGAIVCTPTDPRLIEGSGLLRLDDGFAVVNDGGSMIEVFVLGDDCQVREVRTGAIDPYDVEDLAAGPQDSWWLADIGDNLANRSSVAVEILAPDGSATLHRLSYPDGARDAEALMADEDGRAVIVTKTLSGNSGVYRSGALDPDDDGGPAVPLTHVGQFSTQQTGTAGGPIGPPLSNLMITGAAQCADRVALRTYTDLYLWPADGDIAATIVETPPVVIALPPQQQGESIALSTDCTIAYLHGEGIGTPILAVSLPATLPTDPSAVGQEQATGDAIPAPATGSRVVWTIAALAVLGAVALAAGLRGRRR